MIATHTSPSPRTYTETTTNTRQIPAPYPHTGGRKEDVTVPESVLSPKANNAMPALGNGLPSSHPYS